MRSPARPTPPASDRRAPRARAAGRPAPARPAAPSGPEIELQPGSYVTDGRRLLRCLSVDVSPHPFASALFEDCMTLEVVIVPTVTLPDRRLRLVRA